MTIKIEITNKPDTEAIAALHADCFDIAWRAKEIREMLAIAGTMAFLAEASSTKPALSGFGLLRYIANEAEILTLAVSPAARRQHIATSILDSMRDWAKIQGARALYLEVSEANAAARKLYEKVGFSVISLRKEYYRKTDGTWGNALVLRSSLK